MGDDTFELGAVPATALRQKSATCISRTMPSAAAPDFLFSAVFDCMNLIA